MRTLQDEGQRLIEAGVTTPLEVARVASVGDEAFVESGDGFESRAELRRRFAGTGALEADRVITYCGGGIAASSSAFALHLLGIDDVAVYDGSLSEWGRTDLPMETD